jgi:hypothetical protein
MQANIHRVGWGAGVVDVEAVAFVLLDVLRAAVTDGGAI